MADYLQNGQAHGSVAKRLLQCGGDPGALRPWLGRDGRSYITVNQNGKPKNILTNSPASLLKDQWILLDEAILAVAKPRLRAWGDLMANGLRFNIVEGMAKTVLQYQNRSDISPATISMDGIRKSDRDRPVHDLVNLPLPIIHKDFSFTARELLASQQSANFMGGNQGSGLDFSTGELAGRRVAEEVEKLLLGVTSSYSFGGGSIYGYTNFPDRATKSMTTPTGINGASTLADVLDMKYKSQLLNHFGPWMIYASTSWDQYLDNDYILTGGTVTTSTLRDRLRKIDGIKDVMTVDYLPAKTMLLVEMNPDVVRGVVGMDMVTVDWESEGGMEQNFKVMVIMVPQVRSDQLGNTGIVHGVHS